MSRKQGEERKCHQVAAGSSVSMIGGREDRNYQPVTCHPLMMLTTLSVTLMMTMFKSMKRNHFHPTVELLSLLQSQAMFSLTLTMMLLQFQKLIMLLLLFQRRDMRLQKPAMVFQKLLLKLVMTLQLLPMIWSMSMKKNLFQLTTVQHQL